MLFPFRHSSIFRSRWIALLWAGGIIWLAVDVAGSTHQPGNNGADADNAALTDVTGAPVDAEQMKQAEKLLEQFGR